MGTRWERVVFAVDAVFKPLSHQPAVFMWSLPASALGALSLAAAPRAPESEPHHPRRLAPPPRNSPARQLSSPRSHRKQRRPLHRHQLLSLPRLRRPSNTGSARTEDPRQSRQVAPSSSCSTPPTDSPTASPTVVVARHPSPPSPPSHGTVSLNLLPQ